jgi:hypothetical protein
MRSSYPQVTSISIYQLAATGGKWRQLAATGGNLRQLVATGGWSYLLKATGGNWWQLVEFNLQLVATGGIDSTGGQLIRQLVSPADSATDSATCL